jgi:hypothetical protein
VTITEVGPDVVWSGSGSFNLTDLTLVGSQMISAGFNGNNAIWAIGPSASADQYSGITSFPSTFGSTSIPVSSTIDSTFGILTFGPSGRMLLVPSGYTSNTFISGKATYSTQTIAGMGLTPGTYVYSWGSGPNADQITMIIS